MNYRTIVMPFVVNGEIAYKLLFTCWIYRETVICGFERIRNSNTYPTLKQIHDKCYELAKSWLKKSYYANRVIRRIHEIVQSCRELNVKLSDVEFKNWIMLESREFKTGGKVYTGIKVIDEKSIEVDLLKNYDEIETYTLTTNGVKSRRFRYMLYEVIENNIGYEARIYINGWSRFKVGGVVQVSIPEEIWWKYSMRDFSTYSLNEVEYVLGFDINFDRINWVLIDLNSDIVNMDTIWFEHLVTQGSRSKGCRGFIIQELHKLFNKLKVLEKKKILIAVEKSEVLKTLKLIWIKHGERKDKHWNYRVSRFRAKTIEDIKQVCKQHSIPYIEVDPKGTTHSEEHKQIVQKLGLDRHMASAYLIAKRGLEKLKQII